MEKNQNKKYIIIGAIVLIVIGLVIWQISKDRGAKPLTEEEIKQALESLTAPKRELTPEEQKQINAALKSLTAPKSGPTEIDTPDLPAGSRRNRTAPPPTAPISQDIPQSVLDSLTAPER